MRVRLLPSYEELSAFLAYEPETGLLRWVAKAARNTSIGAVAGTKHHSGYIQIRFNGTLYLAHRIAWKLATGSDPVEEIDHKNGDRQDNRLVNLREATSSQNGMNCVSRTRHTKGIYFSASKRKWIAQIKHNGATRYLGIYLDEASAHAAYLDAARATFGDFVCGGRR